MRRSTLSIPSIALLLISAGVSLGEPEPDSAFPVQRAAVSSAGASEDQVLPGWVLIDLPRPMSRGDFEDWCARFSETRPEAFVSPVFETHGGGVRFPTRDVLVVLESAAKPSPELRPWPSLANGYKTSCASGLEALDCAAALGDQLGVRCAEPDWGFTGRGAGGPDDPSLGQSWALANTGQFGGLAGFDLRASVAWTTTMGSTAIRVAVLDSGIQFNHPDLVVDLGFDVTDSTLDGSSQSPCDDHGTRVAGCIGALLDNGVGSAGIAPACTLISIRTLIGLPACDGSWSSQVSWTVDALDVAQAAGAQVTNNSNSYGFSSGVIAAKYAETAAAGMIHFASAGNLGIQFVTFPASVADVNAVSGVTPTAESWGDTSWGDAVDFCGPSESIYTTDLAGGAGLAPGDFVLADGTSFASALVAGAAALIWSGNPTLTADEVLVSLRENCTDLGPAGWDDRFGWGMPNVAAAVEQTAIQFIRGDVDDSGDVSLPDAVLLLDALFSEKPVSCLPSLDFNADASIDLLDAIGALSYLFAGGAPPASPFPSCGAAQLSHSCLASPYCTP